MVTSDGLVLWLDASRIDSIEKDIDGYVSQWRDLSGNDLVGAQSASDAKPRHQGTYVEFDGNDYLDFGRDVLNMGLDDMTFIAVISTTNLGNRYIFSKSRAAAQHFRYGIRTTNGKIGVFMQGDGGSDVEFTGTQNIADGENHILLWEFDRDAYLSLLVDGELDSRQSIAHWADANMVSVNPARLGSYTASDDTAAQMFFVGTISEFIVYNRVLSDIERQQVEQYLGEKWLGWPVKQLYFADSKRIISRADAYNADSLRHIVKKYIYSADTMRVSLCRQDYLGDSIRAIAKEYDYTVDTFRKVLKEYGYNADLLRRIVKQYEYAADTMRFVVELGVYVGDTYRVVRAEQVYSADALRQAIKEYEFIADTLRKIAHPDIRLKVTLSIQERDVGLDMQERKPSLSIQEREVKLEVE